MTWLTHLRTIVIALGAFALCCGLVTQMMARALGYDASLGAPLLELGSLRLYAPFSFLQWSLAWASVAPSLLFLSLGLSIVCALAAYAVAIVFAKLEPITLAEPSPWRDLASWRKLRHYGLLRDEGLALGAVCRHALAKYRTVRSDARSCVFLGQPQHTDDAVLAALGSWAGSLVLVDARGAWRKDSAAKTFCGSRQVEATLPRSIPCSPFVTAFMPGGTHVSSQAPSSIIHTKRGRPP